MRPADARRRLQVADIGLDRAEQNRAPGIATPAVDRRGCAHFDRIAQFRPGTVHFQVVNVGGRHSRL